MSQAIAIVVVLVLIVGALLIGAVTDWFGSDSESEVPQVTVQVAESTGFVIERDVVDGRVRVLNGTFEGTDASILIPMDGQKLTGGSPVAFRAAQWQQLSGEWEGLAAGEALVICEPVPGCRALVQALAEAVFDS